jgi:hypothetical protein
MKMCELPVPRVGDVVAYPDASEAVVMNRAGAATAYGNQLVALVGSTLSSGDRIVATIWTELETGVLARPGEVTGTQRRAGCVGDFIRYSDGSRARIIIGIGVLGGTHAFAVVGRLLDNDDMITDGTHREASTVTAYVPADTHGLALTRR